MNFDEQRPTIIDPQATRWTPPPDSVRYLLPNDAGGISVREVSYGHKSIARELIEAVVLSLLIFLLVQSVIQNRKVVGSSMEPTLHSDEHLLIDRASYFQYDTNFLPRMLGQETAPVHEAYLLAGPTRGDIVVFRPPIENEDYIKRVIAIPGETVEVKAYDGVYINGRKLDEPYIKDIPDYNWPQSGQAEKVPAGHVFVLGDNRRNSSDSHVWGFLEETSIVGRAWVAYWPREVWGVLPHPSYARLTDPAPAP
ncbi:MAG TPA: signal peptidase I [Chloroflexia bacterium]|nr:signal peptidase I [Chloroflexia bacterium]